MADIANREDFMNTPEGNITITEANSVDPAELQAEINRLNRCLAAYEKAEHRVLNVEINDTKFPPGLTITAPNMDEKRIAEYCIEFYNLFFECAKVVAARNMPMPDLGEVLKTLKELEQTQQQSDSVMPWCQKCKSYHHKKNPSCFDRRATVAEIFRKACIYADLPPGCSAEVMQMIAKMTGMESTDATPENA